MKVVARLLLMLVLAAMIGTLTFGENDPTTPKDPDLEKDRKNLQGVWERGRQVKVIKGNLETLTNLDGTGKVKHRHTVEFKLEKSGEVKIFTFGPVGKLDDKKQTISYVYRLDGDIFYDVPGLIPTRRSYSETPAIYEWYRRRDPDEEKKPSSEE